MGANCKFVTSWWNGETEVRVTYSVPVLNRHLLFSRSACNERNPSVRSCPKPLSFYQVVILFNDTKSLYFLSGDGSPWIRTQAVLLQRQVVGLSSGDGLRSVYTRNWVFTLHRDAFQSSKCSRLYCRILPGTEFVFVVCDNSAVYLFIKMFRSNQNFILFL
jgi:hypothetical protein